MVCRSRVRAIFSSQQAFHEMQKVVNPIFGLILFQQFCTLAYHKKRYPKKQIWGFMPLDLKIIYRLPNIEAAAVSAMLNLPFFIAAWQCGKAMLKIVEACILTFTKNRQNFGSSYY